MALGFRMMTVLSFSVVLLHSEPFQKSETLKANTASIMVVWKDKSLHPGFCFVIGERDGKTYIVTAGHLLRDKDDDPDRKREFETGTVRFCEGPARDLPASPDSTFLAQSLDIGILTVATPQEFAWDVLAEPDSVKFGTSVEFIGIGVLCLTPSSPGRVIRQKNLWVSSGSGSLPSE